MYNLSHQIRMVIYDVCVRAHEEHLHKIVHLEWDDRRIGRTVQVDYLNRPERATFSVSKPLLFRCSNEKQAVAAATCHLISWSHCNLETIAPGLDTLHGYFSPPAELDWTAYAESYRDIVARTCDLLNVGDLAEKIELKWNGRLKRSAGSARWDADTNRGEIQLAKKIWLQMIEDEQVEALVHGICLLVHSRYPELSEELRSADDRRGREYPLLRRCGYKQPQSARQIFPSGKEVAEPIGKPIRLQCVRRFS